MDNNVDGINKTCLRKVNSGWKVNDVSHIQEDSNLAKCQEQHNSVAGSKESGCSHGAKPGDWPSFSTWPIHRRAKRIKNMTIINKRINNFWRVKSPMGISRALMENKKLKIKRKNIDSAHKIVDRLRAWTSQCTQKAEVTHRHGNMGKNQKLRKDLPPGSPTASEPRTPEQADQLLLSFAANQRSFSLLFLCEKIKPGRMWNWGHLGAGVNVREKKGQTEWVKMSCSFKQCLLSRREQQVHKGFPLGKWKKVLHKMLLFWKNLKNKNCFI